MIKFSQKEKKIGAGMYQKFIARKKDDPRWDAVSFKKLYKILKPQEKSLLDKILSIDPKEYGKKVVFYGIQPVPKSLAVIKNQIYYLEGKKGIVLPKFLPKPAYKAFVKMNAAMKKETGLGVNIISGYRSPAFQAVVLFIWLYKYNWDLKKTLRRVTLPGCSEHGYPKKQAIDVAPVKGIKELENFYKTKEYKWLQKNAKRFGFYLSFPPGNKMGIDFEPWHWHFER